MAANALKLKVPNPAGRQTADQLHTARRRHLSNTCRISCVFVHFQVHLFAMGGRREISHRAFIYAGSRVIEAGGLAGPEPRTTAFSGWWFREMLADPDRADAEGSSPAGLQSIPGKDRSSSPAQDGDLL